MVLVAYVRTILRHMTVTFQSTFHSEHNHSQTDWGNPNIQSPSGSSFQGGRSSKWRGEKQKKEMKMKLKWCVSRDNEQRLLLLEGPNLSNRTFEGPLTRRSEGRVTVVGHESSILLPWRTSHRHVGKLEAIKRACLHLLKYISQQHASKL